MYNNINNNNDSGNYVEVVKKSEAELDRYNELKAKKCLLEEKLLRKLEQLYDLCQQEAVSTRFAFLLLWQIHVWGAVLTSL